jgi:hypothetical protein
MLPVQWGSDRVLISILPVIQLEAPRYSTNILGSVTVKACWSSKRDVTSCVNRVTWPAQKAIYAEGAIDKSLIKYALPTVTTRLYREFTQYYFKYWGPYDGRKQPSKYGKIRLTTSRILVTVVTAPNVYQYGRRCHMMVPYIQLVWSTVDIPSSSMFRELKFRRGHYCRVVWPCFQVGLCHFDQLFTILETLSLWEGEKSKIRRILLWHMTSWTQVQIIKYCAVCSGPIRHLHNT